MILQARLGIVLSILFIGVMGFWWWSLSEYRETVSTVASLKVEMEKMRLHVQETERVLAAVESLKVSIQSARSEADAALEDSKYYLGNERLNKLERLLQEDLDRRAGNNAAGGDTCGLPRAGGVGVGATAP